MSQPRLADSQISELLTVGPFLGIDASTSKYFLDPYHANDSIAILPSRAFQGYVTTLGRVHAFAATWASQLYGLSKIERSGSPDLYVGAVNIAGAGAFQQAVLGGSPSALTLPAGFAQTASKETSFVTHQQWLFESNGVDVPLKIDQNLVMTRWGLVAPQSPVTLNPGAGTNLNGVYGYYVTFFNQYQESSPGPVALITITNGAAALSAIPVSGDPQVTGRNIYRFGGTMQEIQLVKTISDNVTTTYTDNLADINVTGQVLVPHRDPPQPFFAIESHKGRVWGFGYAGTAVGNAPNINGASDLWYSNYEEPWGFDNVAQVLPIGRNSGGDYAVELKSLGSILYCLKFNTFWAVTGDTPQDFTWRKLFDVGCISKKSVVRAYSKLFWMSDQGIMMFDGASLVNISDNRQSGAQSSIKGILDQFSFADLAASVGFAYDWMYGISFPTQGITFMYDTMSGQWFKEPWATDRVVTDFENNKEVTASEVGSGVLDSWFAAETDLGLAITSSYVSRTSDSGAPQASKRYRQAVLLAPVQAGATATVSVTVDPGSTQKMATRTVNLGVGPVSHKVSLPPTMVGSEVQITLSVTSTTKTEIHRVSLYGWSERQFVKSG